MQQRPFALFGTYALEEIPQTYSWFEEMREHNPVFKDERTRLWQVFRYEDVLTILTDYSRFSSQAYEFTGGFLKNSLIAKDPPDHRKLRNLVNQAFTPKAVAHLSDRITQITQELLNEVQLQGKMDIVSDIAFPLPAKVIAELLGVPSEDWNIFQRWARVRCNRLPAGRTPDICFLGENGSLEINGGGYTVYDDAGKEVKRVNGPGSDAVHLVKI